MNPNHEHVKEGYFFFSFSEEEEESLRRLQFNSSPSRLTRENEGDILREPLNPSEPAFVRTTLSKPSEARKRASQLVCFAKGMELRGPSFSCLGKGDWGETRAEEGGRDAALSLFYAL